MTHTPPLRSRHSGGRHAQRGAALVYGLFMLVIGLAALFFLFNAGQLTHEKTRLVNTADAVAYSAGVLHARALNDSAYINRALVAQEVLIAQTLSLQSWSRLMAGRVDTVERGVFPECRDPTGRGQVVAATLRFGVDYTLMCSALMLPGVGPAIEAAAQALEVSVPAGIALLEAQKAALQAAQAALHAPLEFERLRGEVLQQVADRNFDGAGPVRVESAGLLAGGLLGLADDWSGFTEHYSGDGRGRMADVVRRSAASDEFVRQRQWTSSAVLPHPVCLGHRNEVRRRGGTELVDFDRWQAADTESWWLARLRRLRCGHVEVVAIGGGFVSAGPAREEDAPGETPHLGDARHNRRAFDNAVDAAATASTAGTAYSGLPGFRDLSSARLAQADADPRLDFSVRVVRERASLRTSDAQSSVAGSERLNGYRSEVAGDVMVAVSTSQVYFARPAEQAQNAWGGRTLGRPEEMASLFNPFWQVRLVDRPGDRATQRLQQAGGF